MTKPAPAMRRQRLACLALALASTAVLPTGAAVAGTPAIVANYPLLPDIGSPVVPSYPPRLGPPVAAVGDLDGNGSRDLVVGSPGSDDGGTDRGGVVVLHMDGTSVASVSGFGGASEPFASLLSDGDQLGAAIAPIGDIDRDGVQDIAVGAPGDDDGATDAGAVWIVRLTASGAVKGADKLSAKSAGVDATYDRFGSSVVSLGDIDGNGLADLAVGAPLADGAEFNAGVVWVVLRYESADPVAIAVGAGDPAFAALLAKRGGFGTSLAVFEGELLVTALGDGSSSEPPATLTAVRVNADASTAGYRRLLPADTTELVVDGAVVPFGDYDFDGNADLVASTTTGLSVLYLDEAGDVRDGYDIRGEWPQNPLRCCSQQANLLSLPDADKNAVRELVTSSQGQLWMLSLNGRSEAGAACGDPGGDGVVKATDALLVLRAAVGLRFCDRLWCDVDRSGAIAASDALAVLRRAISSDNALVCATTTTSTSTTYIAVDECFEDADCSWDPEQPRCCDYECCECVFDEDCGDDEYCDFETCLPDTCIDGEKSGSETGIDCGGPCPTCGAGSGCETNADCTERSCVAGVCALPTCADSVRNGSETGTDCGGTSGCGSCEAGDGCNAAIDCETRICLQHSCGFATCDDRVRNGSETGSDCGGGTCPACSAGKGCQSASDCVSGVCAGGVCQVPTCNDLTMNGTEGDIDCGGPCAGCPE